MDRGFLLLRVDAVRGVTIDQIVAMLPVANKRSKDPGQQLTFNVPKLEKLMCKTKIFQRQKI